MRININDNKEIQPKIKHGDIIQTENMYLVVKGIVQDKVHLIGIDTSLVADYPLDKFQEIVSNWSNCKIFNQDEYCLEIKYL